MLVKQDLPAVLASRALNQRSQPDLKREARLINGISKFLGVHVCGRYVEIVNVNAYGAETARRVPPFGPVQRRVNHHSPHLKKNKRYGSRMSKTSCASSHSMIVRFSDSLPMEAMCEHAPVTLDPLGCSPGQSAWIRCCRIGLQRV